MQDPIASAEELLSSDPIILRDRLVVEACSHFSRSEIAAGIAALAKLEFATIDDETLAKTDRFLPWVAGGRKIIATWNHQRVPADGEVVIIYGNYPHIFENVIVNNPIKRHVSMFGEFGYDDVEYDPRWDRVGQIYIINADDRPDRYDSVLRELVSARAPLHRITRIAALRDQTAPTPQISGTIGCLRSHIEALRRAKAGGFDHALVLEDDFCFTPEVDAHLDDLQSFLNGGYDYLVCLLATSKYGKIIPKDELVCISLQPCTNAAAYLVSGAGLDQLLAVQEFALQQLRETHDGIKYAADRYWSVLQPSGQFLVFRRKLGFQISSFSDIEKRICRYLD